ncbi:hypothetical protein (MCM9-like) [Klebsormidium nitens]|uniref:Probable DNA helicase MCM9 n=1 Tax=Klebsormidium nitens TaxID=105231 RepID=A0A1Y1IL33_KLENI|nr:hypothetical protein (MCM9-like) [Klebsormidium nitens]|eukprot:GAQ89831.1 hypothetical protein (MCM9-like) [Klebsormidium nitens]
MARASQEAVVHDEEYVDALYKFAMEYHAQDLAEILLKPDDDLHYAVHVSFQELHGDERFEAMANLLCCKPRWLLPLFDEALSKAQVDIADVHELQEDMSFKAHVHARVTLMECPEMKPSISRIRCEDIGRILAVRGTIIRTGAVKMLEGEREYECAKCKLRFKVTPQLEQDNKLTLPASCPSDRTKPCKSVTFNYVDESKVCHDYQEIKIQEEMHGLGVGSVPRSIVAVLQDDLVDYCKAGDDVEVTGVLCCKWKPVMKGVRCDLEMVILANSVRKASADKAAVDLSPETVYKFQEYWRQFLDCPLKGRNGILKGICPQVYGLFTVKLAVALTLIGGVARVDKSGTRVRGEPHLLIVGDPGTGKSQFMKYAAKLSARSVVTTGMGSTGAGLTVTAVRDNGEWMLEAGALVLADGGLCCIDEFDGIREADRATIHEAMEQQTLSVAKAGLVTTLNTRCTVFAVCNPKGQYDPDNTLEVNTSLAAPLLSRFDIVLVLLDTKNPDWDRIVSSHILTEHKNAHRADEDTSISSPTPSALWTIDMLRSYIYYVKAAFQPTLTPEAERVIVNYYQLQRRSNAGNRNQARTTIRMLESLVRIAQAHARLMFRHEVLRTDAVVAVVTIESSMTTSAILENMTNALHSSFKDEPDAEYRDIEAQILTALGIPPPSDEERAAEMTRGRHEEGPCGDQEGEKDAEVTRGGQESEPGTESAAKGAEGNERREMGLLVDVGRSFESEDASGEDGDLLLRPDSGGLQGRESEPPEALGSQLEMGERSPSRENEDGGNCENPDRRCGTSEEAQTVRNMGVEDQTVGNDPGVGEAATWQAEARALEARLRGFRQAGVDVSTTDDVGERQKAERWTRADGERSGGPSSKRADGCRTGGVSGVRREADALLGSDSEAKGVETGGLHGAPNAPSEGTGVSKNPVTKNADAENRVAGNPGTELPVCLSPLARRTSASLAGAGSGHVGAAGGGHVAAEDGAGPSGDVAVKGKKCAGRGSLSGGSSGEDVSQAFGGFERRISERGAENAALEREPVSEATGEHAGKCDRPEGASDRRTDGTGRGHDDFAGQGLETVRADRGVNVTGQHDANGLTIEPGREPPSSEEAQESSGPARPLSATSRFGSSETSALIRTLTQRLARPSQKASDPANGVRPPCPEPQLRAPSNQGGLESNPVAPLADRAVNAASGPKAQAGGLGMLRKRLQGRRSAEESEDANWLSDEQWGISSPGAKRARNT